MSFMLCYFVCCRMNCKIKKKNYVYLLTDTFLGDIDKFLSVEVSSDVIPFVLQVRYKIFDVLSNVLKSWKVHFWSLLCTSPYTVYVYCQVFGMLYIRSSKQYYQYILKLMYINLVLSISMRYSIFFFN